MIGVICGRPSGVSAQIPALGPTQLLQCLRECHYTRLAFLIICGKIHECADLAHPFRLLRARRERPRSRRAAEQRDELAAE